MIVDAGPLFALLDRDDRHHAECLALLSTANEPLYVPMLVIAEVTHLAERRLGSHAEIALLNDIAAGLFVAVPLVANEWADVGQLVQRYADMPLGTADASVVVTAKRLGEKRIATLDRRHFDALAREFGFDLYPQ